MTRRPQLLEDRQTEIVLGAALFVLAAWLLYDAYENRGIKRPFPAKLFMP